MKNIQLTIILILMSILMIAQTQPTIDSLYQKLHDNVNIVDPAVKSSDIVWERIDIPANLSLRSFCITNDNQLLIGTEGISGSGGIYQQLNDYNWIPIGLNTSTVYFIGEGNSSLITGVYNRIYKHYNIDSIWQQKFTSNAQCIVYYSIDSLLFVGNSGIIRSDDDGENWELIKNLSGAEDAKAFTATTTDSIFVGTTKYIGDGGGVYLSTDAGITWNHIGLTDHFIASMGTDNNNQVYAGNFGHYETGQGGLYKYNYNNTLWDTIFYFPYITSMVFNSENFLFTGFSLSGAEDWGGVMHTEDNGTTWIIDTTGIGNTWVHDIQIDNNGFLYAMAGYPTMRLYKTNLPVSINKKYIDKDNDFYFYPNPVTNNINIIINNGLSLQNISVSIFNIYGNFICSYEINKNIMEKQVTINTSNLEQGLYICHIQINNKKSNIKFIKR